MKFWQVHSERDNALLVDVNPAKLSRLWEVANRERCPDRAALLCNRLISNGFGGHTLIPQETVCHFLSSPHCTQRLFLVRLVRLLSAFLTFLAFGILLQHAQHEAKW